MERKVGNEVKHRQKVWKSCKEFTQEWNWTKASLRINTELTKDSTDIIKEEISEGFRDEKFEVSPESYNTALMSKDDNLSLHET